MASWLVCSTPERAIWVRLEPWSETLCCFLGKDTLLSQYLSLLHPGVQMGTSEFNAGGNPAMD